MEPKTYTANTEDWIKSSRGMKLLTFVEFDISSTHSNKENFTGTDFFTALEKVSTPIKHKKGKI